MTTTNSGPNSGNTPPSPDRAAPVPSVAAAATTAAAAQPSGDSALLQGQQAAIQARENPSPVVAEEQARYTKAQLLAAITAQSAQRERSPLNFERAQDEDGIHRVTAGEIGAAFHLAGDPETITVQDLQERIRTFLDTAVPAGG